MIHFLIAVILFLKNLPKTNSLSIPLGTVFSFNEDVNEGNKVNESELVYSFRGENKAIRLKNVPPLHHHITDVAVDVLGNVYVVVHDFFNSTGYVKIHWSDNREPLTIVSFNVFRPQESSPEQNPSKTKIGVYCDYSEDGIFEGVSTRSHIPFRLRPPRICNFILAGNIWTDSFRYIGVYFARDSRWSSPLDRLDTLDPNSIIHIETATLSKNLALVQGLSSPTDSPTDFQCFSLPIIIDSRFSSASGQNASTASSSGSHCLYGPSQATISSGNSGIVIGSSTVTGNCALQTIFFMDGTPLQKCALRSASLVVVEIEHWKDGYFLLRQNRETVDLFSISAQAVIVTWQMPGKVTHMRYYSEDGGTDTPTIPLLRVKIGSEVKFVDVAKSVEKKTVEWFQTDKLGLCLFTQACTAPAFEYSPYVALNSWWMNFPNRRVEDSFEIGKLDFWSAVPVRDINIISLDVVNEYEQSVTKDLNCTRVTGLDNSLFLRYSFSLTLSLSVENDQDAPRSAQCVDGYSPTSLYALSTSPSSHFLSLLQFYDSSSPPTPTENVLVPLRGTAHPSENWYNAAYGLIIGFFFAGIGIFSLLCLFLNACLCCPCRWNIFERLKAHWKISPYRKHLSFLAKLEGINEELCFFWSFFEYEEEEEESSDEEEDILIGEDEGETEGEKRVKKKGGPVDKVKVKEEIGIARPLSFRGFSKLIMKNVFRRDEFEEEDIDDDQLSLEERKRLIKIAEERREAQEEEEARASSYINVGMVALALLIVCYKIGMVLAEIQEARTTVPTMRPLGTSVEKGEVFDHRINFRVRHYRRTQEGWPVNEFFFDRRYPTTNNYFVFGKQEVYDRIVIDKLEDEVLAQESVKVDYFGEDFWERIELTIWPDFADVAVFEIEVQFGVSNKLLDPKSKAVAFFIQILQKLALAELTFWRWILQKLLPINRVKRVELIPSIKVKSRRPPAIKEERGKEEIRCRYEVVMNKEEVVYYTPNNFTLFSHVLGGFVQVFVLLGAILAVRRPLKTLYLTLQRKGVDFGFFVNVVITIFLLVTSITMLVFQIHYATMGIPLSNFVIFCWILGTDVMLWWRLGVFSQSWKNLPCSFVCLCCCDCDPTMGVGWMLLSMKEMILKINLGFKKSKVFRLLLICVGIIQFYIFGYRLWMEILALILQRTCDDSKHANGGCSFFSVLYIIVVFGDFLIVFFVYLVIIFHSSAINKTKLFEEYDEKYAGLFGAPVDNLEDDSDDVSSSSSEEADLSDGNAQKAYQKL